jgi:hypothetical protein
MNHLTRCAVAVALSLPLVALGQAATDATKPQAGDPPSASTAGTPKKAKTARKRAATPIQPATDAGSPTTRSPSTPTAKNDGTTKP